MSAKNTDKKENDGKTSGDISEHLEQVFLAGLGALSTATDVGAKTFESLVNQGQAYREAASRKTEDLIEEVQDAVREVTEGAQTRASGLIDQVRERTGVDRLHDVFDNRVGGALKRLGVPTQSDVDDLNAKLDKLIELVEAKKAKPAAKKRTAKKATTKKRTVAKKATGK
jgi:poly(hydroxyalkanoate) granule-associated protein